VYLCYFDESGDSGVPDPPVVMPPTDCFVLACVVTHETDWLTTLDALISLRRRLRDNYGIKPSGELKGAHFRTGKGAFTGLGITRRARMTIYNEMMNYQSTLPLQTFAIAIHKLEASQ